MIDNNNIQNEEQNKKLKELEEQNKKLKELEEQNKKLKEKNKISNKETEDIQNEEQIKKNYNDSLTRITNKLNNLENDLSLDNLSIEEKNKKINEATKIIIDNEYKKLGVDSLLANNLYKNLRDGITPLSDIIKTLGVMITEEEIRIIDFNYKFSELLPIQQVENGIIRILYNDYFEIDRISGYDNVSIDDYNPNSLKAAEEIYKTKLHIHKGFAILDSILNDVVLTQAHFISLLVSFRKAVAQPIAKELYSYRLKRIADEFFDDETYLNNDYNIDIDMSKITPEITLSETELVNNFIKIKQFIDGLSTISRNNIPNDKYKINGLSNNIERSVNSKDLIILMSNELAVRFQMEIKSNAFNEKYFNELPLIVGIDYEKSFKEYGNIKNLTNNHFFIIEKGFGKIITHYTGSKIVDTPKLKKVYHEYLRFGFAKYKDKFKFLGLIK